MDEALAILLGVGILGSLLLAGFGTLVYLEDVGQRDIEQCKESCYSNTDLGLQNKCFLSCLEFVSSRNDCKIVQIARETDRNVFVNLNTNI